MRNATATGFTTAGAVLVLLAAWLLGQAYLGTWIRDLDRPAAAQEMLPPRVQSGLAYETSALDSAVPAALDLGVPYWLRAPAFELNAGISEVGIVNGEYDVPLWDVGWQNDSPPLGQPGNTVFNGHVDTINGGRVFATLHRAQPGDAVYVYTDRYRTEWVVEAVDVLPNADHSFLAPSDDIRMTLYTCEGDFSWATQQYSHYRVVVAKYVGATERSATWDSSSGIGG